MSLSPYSLLGLTNSSPRTPTVSDAIGDLCWLAFVVTLTVVFCGAALYGLGALWVLDPLNVVR